MEQWLGRLTTRDQVASSHPRSHRQALGTGTAPTKLSCCFLFSLLPALLRFGALRLPSWLAEKRTRARETGRALAGHTPGSLSLLGLLGSPSLSLY